MEISGQSGSESRSSSFKLVRKMCRADAAPAGPWVDDALEWRGLVVLAAGIVETETELEDGPPPILLVFVRD